MNNKKTTDRKKNKNGFTLIELLATIAVLSIIVTIVIFVSTNIVNNARKESYKVTINNIEKIGGSYVYDNPESNVWVQGITSDYEYQCLSVQNLIDKGYFNSDVLSSEIDRNEYVKKEHNIYVERDVDTKTITKQILLYKEEYLSLCSNFDTTAIIDISYGPDGWAKQKDIDIKYRLYNNTDSISNYKYNYSYNSELFKTSDVSFKSRTITENKTVNENGSLYAYIKMSDGRTISKTQSISKIDSIRPSIDYQYNGDAVVRNQVKLSLTLVDNESGINASSFTQDDLIVTIGGDIPEKVTLTKVSNNNYDLEIKDNIHDGKVIIEIKENKIYDNVGNGNNAIKLEPNLSFTNKYTVTYYLGNGTSTEGSTEIGTSTCTYGEDCTLNAWSSFGKSFPESDNGWNFFGWSTSETGTTRTYKNGQKFTYTNTKDIKLYAIGYRTFKFYSGVAPTSVLSSQTQYWNPYSTSTTYVTSIDVPTATEIDGWTFIGYRANNTASSTVTFSKTGSNTPVPTKLTAFDFRSIYERTLTISYDGNGNTSGTTDNTTKIQYYNSGIASGSKNAGANVSNPKFTLAANEFTKTGHTFSKWNTSSDGSGTNYDAGGSYTDWNPSVTDVATKTLYAQWTANKYTISYDANGGNDAPENQIKTHGKSLMLSSSKPTKNYYTFTGWNTKKDGSGTAYAAGASYTTDSSVTLYAQWRINKVYVQFDTNDGKVTSSTTGSDGNKYTWTTDSNGVISRSINGGAANNKFFSIKYGSSGDLPNYNNNAYLKITRTGYKAKANAQWKCLSGCTTSGKTFDHSVDYAATDFCNPKSADCIVVVGVNWEIKTYTISYDANGGNNAPDKQTKTYNVDLTLSSSVPTRTGYTFTGWNTALDGSGTSYAKGAKYTKNANVTLYAQWKIKTYTISYDANGGDNAPDKQTKTYNVDLTLSNGVPTRTGYTFTGWNTASDGSGTSYEKEAKYTENANVTLYAQWKVNNYVRIYYNVDGGIVTSSTTTKGGITYNWTTNEDIVYRNGNKLKTSIKYGGTVDSNDGLTNYNNSQYLNITKKGYIATSGAEWVCLEGCTVDSKTFSQKTTTYTANDFCDASNGDCEVILGVNWRPADGCYQVTTTSGLRCRPDMSTNYTEIGYLYALTSYQLTYGGMNGGYGWFAYDGFSKKCYARGDYLKYVGSTCSSPSDVEECDDSTDDCGDEDCTSWKQTISGRCNCYSAASWLGSFSTSCSAKGLGSSTACSNWCRNYASGASMTSSTCQITYTCSE